MIRRKVIIRSATEILLEGSDYSHSVEQKHIQAQFLFVTRSYGIRESMCDCRSIGARTHSAQQPFLRAWERPLSASHYFCAASWLSASVGDGIDGALLAIALSVSPLYIFCLHAFAEPEAPERCRALYTFTVSKAGCGHC